MKTILQNKSSRINFLLLIATLLVLIILVRAFILPLYSAEIAKDPVWLTVTTRLLDSLFVSLIVTVGIGLFLFHIELPEEQKKFEIVEALRIGELLDKQRKGTKLWYFSGGTGRYTRTVTIPELSKKANRTNSHITVKLQLINPNSNTACENYANYRNNLKSAQKTKWDAHFVRLECVTTIVSAIIHKSKNTLLDISLCLKENFSTVRIDMASTSAVLTKEDPSEPALVCWQDSFLYRTYEEEFLQTFKQCRQINSSFNLNITTDEPTIENIKFIVTKLKIQDGLTDEDYESIIGKLQENKNQYA
jgi:hypothetical protein